MRAPIVGGLAAVTCCTHFALFVFALLFHSHIENGCTRMNGRSSAHMFRPCSVRSKSERFSLQAPSLLPSLFRSLLYLTYIRFLHASSSLLSTPRSHHRNVKLSAVLRSILLQRRLPDRLIFGYCVCLCMSAVNRRFRCPSVMAHHENGSGLENWTGNGMEIKLKRRLYPFMNVKTGSGFEKCSCGNLKGLILRCSYWCQI